MRHVLRSQDFDVPTLMRLFKRTDETIETLRVRGLGSLKNVFPNGIAVLLFYEPSTRTRFSFTFALLRLGMSHVSTENAAEFSSAKKGELLEDSIRVICEYGPSVIIIRHKESGAAERAAEVADKYGVSVINAGDGDGQHPTQSLLDLYTIYKLIGRTHDLKVTIGGDLLRGRTARSLAYLLSKFPNNSICFVSPDNLRMKKDILDHLSENGVSFRETDNLKESLPGADVVYWTRTQNERPLLISKRGNVKLAGLISWLASHIRGREQVDKSSNLVIDPKAMSMLNENSILLHPLPRIDEITREVDPDPRAKYFQQAGFGMYVRMALLQMLLSNKL